MKICSKCKKVKNSDCFGIDKSTTDKLNRICKECLRESRKKHKATCVSCGNDFMATSKNAKYCSVKCKPQSSKKRIEVKCCICDKSVFKTEYQVNRGYNHYCSRECKCIGNSIFFNGENSPNVKEKIKCKCNYCGNTLELDEYRYNKSDKHYCNNSCKYENRKIWYKGENHKGYSRVKFNCDICGKESMQQRSQYSSSKHHYCSKECSNIGTSVHYSGENSPSYNDNISDEDRLKGRFIEGYKAFILSVYNRDNYTCQCCGDSKGGNLNAHHLDGYNWCNDKRIDADNGVTLCDKCHKEFHSKYGYGCNTKEQYYEYVSSKYGNTEVNE